MIATIKDVLAEAVSSHFPGRTVVTEQMITVTITAGLRGNPQATSYDYDIHFKGDEISVLYTKSAFMITEGTLVLNRWNLNDPNVDPDAILEFFMRTVTERFRVIM